MATSPPKKPHTAAVGDNVAVPLSADDARAARVVFGDLGDWERALAARFPESTLAERCAAIGAAERQRLASRYPPITTAAKPTPEPEQQDEPELEI
jgi:hypothetical protein